MGRSAPCLMSFDLPRVEHIHVDVDVDLVRRAAQPVELREHHRSCASQVIDADLLDARAVEQRLFEWIREPHASHDDLAVGKRRVEMRVEPHAVQRTPGGDGHGHST